MSISSCSSLTTNEMLQQLPNIVLMTPTKTFDSTKEIEKEIEQMDNETSRLRKAHVYKCLFDLVRGMPDELIKLILKYDVPSKLTVRVLERCVLKPKILYGIVINDNSSLIPIEYRQLAGRVEKGIQGFAFYGRKGDFSVIIQEKEKQTGSLKLTKWEDTDSAMKSKEIHLRIKHIAADNRREYNIILPGEGSFYKIYQIHNLVEAAKFEKVTLIYDSREPLFQV